VKDNEFIPVEPMPSFLDKATPLSEATPEKITTKAKRKPRAKPQEKLVWSYRFWEREKKGKPTIKRKAISSTNPMLLALLAMLVMVLGLLAPATLCAAKATDSLSTLSEGMLRRLKYGNDTKDKPSRSKKNSEGEV
jgi:hypothetical protein